MIGLNILGTAAVLFLMVAPNSDLSGPSEGWARLFGVCVILLAIWMG